MPRTILIHLNVELPDESRITADVVEALVQGALDVGLEGAAIEIPVPVVTLCEEV